MADTWFIKRDEDKAGPYNAAQLKAMTATGHLLLVDLVTKGEGGKWVPASQIKGLFVPLAAEPVVAPTDLASESFDFGQPGPTPKTSLPETSKPGSLPISDRLKSLSGGLSGKAKLAIGRGLPIFDRLKSQAGGLSGKAKLAIGGGLLLLFMVGGSCVMFGDKSGKNTGGGSPGAGRGRLSSSQRENSEYKRGYSIGSELAVRVVNSQANALDSGNAAVRASAMKHLNKLKRDYEKSYDDLLRIHGPDNDGTLLYRGMLDGYMEEVTKAGVTLD
ncbi:hypothetical protein BH11PLA2_BH11PLA2_16330 [soil metagenome]